METSTNSPILDIESMPRGVILRLARQPEPCDGQLFLEKQNGYTAQHA